MGFHTRLIASVQQRLFDHGLHDYSCHHTNLHNRVSQLEILVFLLDCMDIIHGPHLTLYEGVSQQILNPNPIKPEHQWLSDDYESHHPTLDKRARDLNKYAHHIRRTLHFQEDLDLPNPVKVSLYLKSPTHELVAERYGFDAALDLYLKHQRDDRYSHTKAKLDRYSLEYAKNLKNKRHHQP